MSFSVPDTGESRLKKSSTAAADAGIGGKMPGKLKNIGMTVLFAVPVFFVFVLTARIGGYDLLDLHPANVLPPIPVYLADFRLTVTTKLLIGSIVHLFTDTVSLQQMYVICSIANIVAVAALSLFFGALLTEGIKKRSFAVLFSAVLCIVNPLLSQEYYPAIGSYNTYWTVIFVILIFLYGKISFAFTVPLLCITGMFVHDGFLFAFLPVILVLLVYDFFNREEKRKKLISAVAFGVTSAICGGTFVYSSFFQNKHLSMTADEFYSYMLSRFSLLYSEKLSLNKLYGDRLFPYSFFEIYFFDKLSSSEVATEMELSVYLKELLGYKAEVLPDFFYLRYAVVLIPFALLFAVLWFACAKKSSGTKKIPFIFFACIQLVILPVSVISTDLYRWIPAIIISQAGAVFAMLKKGDKTFSDVLDSPVLKKTYIKVILIVSAVLLTAYMIRFGMALPMNDDVI